MTQKIATKSLVTMALFAGMLCVSAYISVPLPNGSHITFLNFMVMLIAFLFPATESGLIVLVWLLLGAVGLPVFIGGSAGLGYLISPYGGYSFAFLIVAILIPLLRGKEYHRIRVTAVAIASVIFVDLFGAAWWMLLGHLGAKEAFVLGFLPFIVLDLVKAVVVAQIVPAFRRIVVDFAVTGTTGS